MVRRRGVTLLISLIAMAVMFTLGLAIFSFARQSHGTVSMMAADLKAREAAKAVLEEARGVVYALVNQAGEESDVRRDLIEKCQRLADDVSGNAPRPTGKLLSIDLLGKRLLPVSVAAARESGVAITTATVEFTGFRRIGYGFGKLFLEEDSFYRDPRGKLERDQQKPEPRAPHDWVGYYRIHAGAAFGRARRSLSAVHDVKIVSTAPMARDFALFSWVQLPMIGSRGDSGGGFRPSDPDYQTRDLTDRKSGPFTVYPRREGRVFVRGPLVAPTEGWPDGTGPEERPGTLSQRGGKWWGWGQVPSPRDGIVESTLGFFSTEPKRPLTTAHEGWLSGLARDTVGFTGGDPGLYMLEDHFEYHCESHSPDGHGFSVYGNPAGGAFDMYRGYLVRRTDSSTTYELNSRHVYPNGDLTFRDPTGQEEDKEGDPGWSMCPEGGLMSVCNVVSCDHHGNIVRAGYEVRFRESVRVPYGVYWEGQRVEGVGSGLFRFASAIVKAITYAEGAGLIDWGVTTFLSSAGAQLLDQVVGEIAGKGNRGSGATVPGEIDTTQLKSAFAPGFRRLGRAVTRRLPSFKDLGTMQRGEPVTLDGIVECVELSCETPFAYRGRGYLYTAPKSTVRLPSLIQPVENNVDGQAPAHLLSIYVDGSLEHADQGQQALELVPASGTDAPADDADPGVRASVYSTQGVRSAGKVRIVGNLVCGLINKSKIGHDGGVTVEYDRECFLHPDRNVWHDGSLHVVAVSHRTCQAVEW